MSTKDNRMSLKEYMRELILMKKQYGQEEELYPLINMFLRSNDSVLKDRLSVRTVASGRTGYDEENTQNIVRNMLYGYASFPDLVILDEKYDPLKINTDDNDKNSIKYQKNLMYGCVEAKSLDYPVIDLTGEKHGDDPSTDVSVKIKLDYKDYAIIYDKASKKRARYVAECKILSLPDASKILNKYSDKDKPVVDWDAVCNELEFGKWYLCPATGTYAGAVEEANHISSRTKANFNKMEEIYDNKGIVPKPFCGDKAYMKIERLIEIYLNDDPKPIGEKYNNDDIKQLFGELLWYGKVLYTNGIKWRYLKLSDDNTELNSKLDGDGILTDCFDLNDIKGKTDAWIEKIKGTEFNIHFTDIGDISIILESLKDDSDCLCLDKTESLNDNDDEWTRLIDSLAAINWTGTSRK